MSLAGHPQISRQMGQTFDRFFLKQDYHILLPVRVVGEYIDGGVHLCNY